jgi:hypothetical protein
MANPGSIGPVITEETDKVGSRDPGGEHQAGMTCTADVP